MATASSTSESSPNGDGVNKCVDGLERLRLSKSSKEKVEKNCTVCLHRGEEIKAENMCSECGNNMYLCEGCTDVHASERATRSHAVVSLVLPPETKKTDNCKLHPTYVVNRFCKTCQVCICVVCVMKKHGNHEVETLASAIDKKVQIVKRLVAEKEAEMKEFELKRDQLAALSEIAKGFDLDAALKEIDDRADEMIERVQRWKEEQLREVRVSFRGVGATEE